MRSKIEMEPQPGQKITANLRLISQLSKGGMGSVWLADHLALETQVVVKFILAEKQDTDHMSHTRFKREASLAAKIKSPHVVQTHDYGLTEDGTPFIVMELLEGESLAQHLDRVGRLSPKQTAVIVSQVAKALEKAHRLGIVHRDLKPANLFLVDSGYELFVKVLDFGIAKHTRATDGLQTSSSDVVGTPYFMSPEQLLGKKPLDGYVDRWALAAVAFTTMIGRLPFVADTIAELTLRIVMEPPLKPSSLLPELGPKIDAWFARAFSEDKTDRFASAVEMAEALEQAVDDTPDDDLINIRSEDGSEPPTQRAPPKSDQSLSTVNCSATDQSPELGASEDGSNPNDWSLAPQTMASPELTGLQNATVQTPATAEEPPVTAVNAAVEDLVPPPQPIPGPLVATASSAVGPPPQGVPVPPVEMSGARRSGEHRRRRWVLLAAVCSAAVSAVVFFLFFLVFSDRDQSAVPSSGRTASVQPSHPSQTATASVSTSPSTLASTARPISTSPTEAAADVASDPSRPLTVRPRPVVSHRPPSRPSAKLPPDCQGEKFFTLDKNGDRIPRQDCMR